MPFQPCHPLVLKATLLQLDICTCKVIRGLSFRSSWDPDRWKMHSFGSSVIDGTWPPKHDPPSKARRKFPQPFDPQTYFRSPPPELGPRCSGQCPEQAIMNRADFSVGCWAFQGSTASRGTAIHCAGVSLRFCSQCVPPPCFFSPFTRQSDCPPVGPSSWLVPDDMGLGGRACPVASIHPVRSFATSPPKSVGAILSRQGHKKVHIMATIHSLGGSSIENISPFFPLFPLFSVVGELGPQLFLLPANLARYVIQKLEIYVQMA